MLGFPPGTAVGFCGAISRMPQSWCAASCSQVTGVEVTAELARLGAQNFTEDEASAVLAARLDFRHEDATDRASDAIEFTLQHF